MKIENNGSPSIVFTEQTVHMDQCITCRVVHYSVNYFSHWAKCLGSAFLMGCVIQSYGDFMANSARCWEYVEKSNAPFFIPIGIIFVSCHIGYRLYWIGRGKPQ